jgi:carbohydrate-binding DOMON domain-containing protein
VQATIINLATQTQTVTDKETDTITTYETQVTTEIVTSTPPAVSYARLLDRISP